MKSLLFFLSLMSTIIAAPISTQLIGDFEKLSYKEIELRLPNAHPANYYLYAGRLWRDNQKDQAVFWLNAGQLRLVFHAEVNAGNDTSDEAEIFESLQVSIGDPIKLYAASDPKKWLRQVDAVLKWDAKTANGFTSKKDHPKELAKARAQLVKMREQISNNQEKLRTMSANGGRKEETKLVNGIKVEIENRPMPSDWPALLPHTNLQMIEGVYEATFLGLMGPHFFDFQKESVAKAKTFVLSADGDHQLRVQAFNGEERLNQIWIDVTTETNAVVFTRVKTGAVVNLEQGQQTLKFSLRLNTAGNLVFQCDYLIDGVEYGAKHPVHHFHTSWNFAHRLSPIISGDEKGGATR